MHRLEESRHDRHGNASQYTRECLQHGDAQALLDGSRGELKPDVAAADDRETCARDPLRSQALHIVDGAQVVKIGTGLGQLDAGQHGAPHTGARGKRQMSVVNLLSGRQGQRLARAIDR